MGEGKHPKTGGGGGGERQRDRDRRSVLRIRQLGKIKLYLYGVCMTCERLGKPCDSLNSMKLT